MPDLMMSDLHFQIAKLPNCQIAYSVLKLFTGFAIAAFIAWKLTVINVIINAPNPEKIKTQNDICVL
jgi:hypothetical protein